MTGLRSSLSNCTPSGPATPEEVRSKARTAWHESGIILINPEWLTSWTERKQAEILAERLFGKRQGKPT